MDVNIQTHGIDRSSIVPGSRSSPNVPGSRSSPNVPGSPNLPNLQDGMKVGSISPNELELAQAVGTVSDGSTVGTNSPDSKNGGILIINPNSNQLPPIPRVNSTVSDDDGSNDSEGEIVTVRTDHINSNLNPIMNTNSSHISISPQTTNRNNEGDVPIGDSIGESIRDSIGEGDVAISQQVSTRM